MISKNPLHGVAIVGGGVVGSVVGRGALMFITIDSSKLAWALSVVLMYDDPVKEYCIDQSISHRT